MEVLNRNQFALVCHWFDEETAPFSLQINMLLLCLKQAYVQKITSKTDWNMRNKRWGNITTTCAKAGTISTKKNVKNGLLENTWLNPKIAGKTLGWIKEKRHMDNALGMGYKSKAVCPPCDTEDIDGLGWKRPLHAEKSKSKIRRANPLCHVIVATVVTDGFRKNGVNSVLKHFLWRRLHGIDANLDRSILVCVRYSKVAKHFTGAGSK
ncbi:hypothetical protein LguiB_028337 [Lonicera macranthoides]